jgi:gliding motility-associated-like protein
VHCVNAPILFQDFVRYYTRSSFDNINARNYWSEPDRQAAGKEMLWWDIGDGRGFATTGSSPVVSYSKPGTYTIRLVARDSLGCFDTLTLPNFIQIVQVKAKPWVQDSVFLCAPQIVVFRDSSQFVDEFGNVDPLTPDSIKDWYWDFDDNKQPRILPNPAHNFTTNGTFNVMLVVTTEFGCIDTAFRTITLRGPVPRFTIDDTLGCAPFTAIFRNTTGQQLLSWTWRFGDSSNTILSTTSDSSVQFLYNKPGIYRVSLIGIDTLTNPNTGNLLTCTAIFPDTTTGLPTRDIYVEFTPPVELFAPDTICPDEEVEFVISPSPVYDRFNWYFTPTDSIESLFPDTVQRFTYTAPGVYSFMMIPTSLTQILQCVDTLRKEIVVQDIEADFELDRQLGRQYNFVNRSRAASRYEWFLGKETLQNPFSREQNPTYTYPSDSVFFNICLVAYNEQDCWDSICKEYTFFADIKIYNVFTPDNGDNVNDAFDIEIQGEKKYHLRIYNRWGGLVFEGFEDGENNDGKNWNGKINNTGDECAAGVYYYIFTYQFLTDTEDRSVNGTITLIRK